MEKVERCAIYIRVSTVEQAMYGKSLQAQSEYLTAYANEHNMSIVGTFADEGKTARKNFKNRKAIKALLEYVKQDKIDVILFWKMDRWFRSVSDFYKVQDILDAHNVKWIAVAEPNINMDTREGRLNLNIILSIGQNETDTTSERIKFVNESSVHSGRVIYGSGSMPLGYKVGFVDGIKKITKDSGCEETVTAAFDYFLLHQTKRGTVSYIRDHYMNTFTSGMLESMLKSTLYKGQYRENKNYCPPYITPEQWEHIQEILKHNIRGTPSGNVYLFTGMIRCPLCGKMMHGYYSRRYSKVYIYYRCTYGAKNSLHKIKGINESKIESCLTEHITEKIEEFGMALMQVQKSKNRDRKATEEDLQKELGRLNYMYQKGRIAADKYEQEYKKLRQKIKTMEEQTAKSSNVTDLHFLQATFSGNWTAIYTELTRENRQAFWRSFIKQIVINENNDITDLLFF